MSDATADEAPRAPLADLLARTVDLAARTPPARLRPVAGIDLDDVDLAAHLAERRWSTFAPARFASASIDDLEPVVVDVIAEWLSDPAPPANVPTRNLVLVGPVGTGKTWAACAAVRPLIEAGAGAVLRSVVEVLDDLRPGGPAGTLDRLATVDVLVLDDLGAERVTDWTGERLLALVDRRWRNMLPTVTTTNLEPRDLAAAVGERTYSRIVGGAAAVRLSGHDLRRRPPNRTQENP